MAITRPSCETCAVRHRALCAALSNEELTRLNRIARHRHLAAGQIIFTDQEPPDFFGNIIDGVVKLTKTLADGRQQIVALQFPSEFLGRPYRLHNPYFAEAATKVTLCTYPKDQFERFLHEWPGLEHKLLEHTLSELDAAHEWMLLLGRKTALEKVASLLFHVARRFQGVGCQSLDGMNFATFQLPLSRADIADYLGLTIETVSRQITLLKTRGVILVDGGRAITVPDMAKLEALAEVEQA